MNAEEINPPTITTDPVIEYCESIKPKGFIKYGTIKPNPLRLPKYMLNVTKIILKFLFLNNFNTAYLNEISLSVLAKPDGGVGALLLNRNTPGMSNKLIIN